MKENMTIKGVSHNDIPIEEKVAFLKKAEGYPYPNVKVETKETHMSWVFLVDGIAYKLKKPVENLLFDFRTIEARLKNCREELRLNRRLAPGIYLGIIPLTINRAGKLQLERRGKIVDWLVKMRRIPEENMLDYAITHHRVDTACLQKAAKLLIEFYQTSRPVSITISQYIRRLESDILSNYADLSRPVFSLPAGLIKKLITRLTTFISNNQSLFAERVNKKKIIEAHGDLRPEHISMGASAAIIDRLEFNRKLRVMDIAEELSFLGIECEMLGNDRAGQLFLDEYTQITSDNISGALITFYKIKKACLRAYLVARHKEEERYRDDPKWLAKATAYLALAERYSRQLKV